MVRLLPEASGLLVVSVAISRRNRLFTVGSLAILYPSYSTLLMLIRYVLKIKDTDEVIFVVVFSLLHKEDFEKEEAASKRGDENSKVTDQRARHEGEKDFEPKADDLD